MASRRRWAGWRWDSSRLHCGPRLCGGNPQGRRSEKICRDVVRHSRETISNFNYVLVATIVGVSSWHVFRYFLGVGRGRPCPSSCPISNVLPVEGVLPTA